MSESLSITPSNAITFDLQSSLTLAGAEISAFDPGSKRLFVTCSGGLQVVDLSDPAAPALVTTVDFTALGFATTDITSVAVRNGLVAVALPDADKALNGKVVFLDAATLAQRGAVSVGALPDMLTFTPDGSKVLVANEGELNEDGTDGDGSVSIIEVPTATAAATVRTATFDSFDGQEEALRDAGVRIFAGRSVSQDVEPEYVAISADGTKAMVTLQEANAVAILDIASATFTAIVPLGSKDFSTLLADFSDKDGGAELATGNPVSGLYMPDAIDSYQAGGATYYVIANEGDDRNDFLATPEAVRLEDLELDAAAFPDAAELQAEEALGRLTVANAPGLDGDTDGDGDIDEILAYGGRSFSILDADGAIVFDSADLIERIVAAQFPGLLDDARSDNKGPEPEGIEIAGIGGKTYALVGLERSNLTLAFDITDPAAVTYAGAARRDGDEAPEGTLFIAAEDSPTGQALYVASNEGSDNISVFAVEAAPTTFTLQILHASDFEAGLKAVDRAPQFAAIVDRLEDSYANSITLASGDNYIPSPFFNAEGDAAMTPVLRAFYAQLLGVDDSLVAGLATDLGRIDIAIMNALGVQASVFGNHEFDLGTRTVANAIDMTASSAGLATSIGALFPYLSANLDFSADADLKNLFTAALRDAASYATTAADLDPAAIAAEAADQQIAPWTTIQENGETIGVLGVTTQLLASISTLNGVTVKDPAGDGGVNNTSELAQILQPYVDQMTAQGIDKIILLSHLQQYSLELELATRLSGVDVIIAGGSHAVFADATDSLAGGLTAAEGYPVFRTGADGNAVAIVNTGSEYYNVGRLVVTFDAEGVIIPDSVDPDVSGAYVADDATVDALYGESEDPYADGTRGGEVKQLTDAIDAIIDAKTSVVAGYSDVYLMGQRAFVRTQETNFGNLTADANLAFAKSVDAGTIISLKNGGGIREGIGVVGTGEVPSYEPPADGRITQLDIENALRFNNGLSLITVSAQGLLDMLENALRGVAPGATPGSFPQVSGLRFSFDAARAAGDRVISLAVVDADGEVVDVVAQDGAAVGDLSRSFRLVTLNFLADGGDGYLGAGGGATVTVTDRVDLFDPAGANVYGAAGREQKALADYLAATHGTPDAAFDVAETSTALDTRVQNLAARADEVLEGSVAVIRATGGGDDLGLTGAAERLNAGAGDDSVRGNGGADSLGGGLGADSLAGGEGDDKLHGGDGADTLAGDAGADTLAGVGGADLLDGGLGRDLLFGGAGADTLQGRDGNDVLKGGTEADLLRGEAGSDRLAGDDGADTLVGGNGIDRLTGGAGSDYLIGGAGADTLAGGAGADRMNGGIGADVFVYAALSDSSRAAQDRILSFAAGQDRIDLSAIDAQAGAAGDQAFAFVTGAFLGGGTGSLRVAQAGGDTLVLVDGGDGGAAEMVIRLAGTIALQQGDFVL